MKRVFLFLATNLAILLVLGIFLNVVLRALGITYHSNEGFLIFAFIFGMGGAFISLAMSKWIALKSTGAQVISQPRNDAEIWLLQTVREQARRAGIGMPDVAIYSSQTPNAFATGMKRNDALVAVSSGLLSGMNRDDIEAVLGHEISHVANGDMVTLALIQGVVNTFVFFLARIIGRVVDQALSGGRQQSGYGFGFFIATFVAEVVLGFLASLIVLWFSRQREFRADRGGARLAGSDKMISALQRLRTLSQDDLRLPSELKAFGINEGRKTGFARLLMSHPPLEERIRRLQNSTPSERWGGQ